MSKFLNVKILHDFRKSQVAVSANTRPVASAAHTVRGIFMSLGKFICQEAECPSGPKKSLVFLGRYSFSPPEVHDGPPEV